MRKIFIFLAALSLMGAASISFSCSKYDEQIEDLNSRLDQIEGSRLASMEEQIASLQKVLASLKDVEISEIKDAQSVLDAKISNLEKRLAGIEDWQDACEATYATLTDLGELETKLGNQIALAKEEAIEAAGKAFEEVYRSKLNAVIAMWQGGSISSDDPTVQALYDFMKEYDKQVTDIVNEILLNKGIVTEQGFKDLSDLVKKLEKRVEALENRIYDLENRIQSLSFVPTKMLNSTLYYGITLKGDDWYSWTNEDGEEHMEYIKNAVVGPHRATLHYRVTPAKMAEKFSKENVSFVVNHITRADDSEMPVFKADKVEAVKENGEYTGEIIVEAITDYTFTLEEKYNNWASSKVQAAYSLALQVKIENPNSSADQVFTGIDYMSDFIIVNWSDGNNVMNSVWFVEGTEDGWNTALNEKYQYKKLYSDTSVREFYGNWAFMKVDKSDPANYIFTPISEVYPRVKVTLQPIDKSGNLITDLTSEDILPTLESENGDHISSYLLDYKSMQIKDGKNVADLVGDKIVSNRFGVVITILDEEGNVMFNSRTWEKQSFQETVEIVDAL